jgi:hypothetical protein
MWRGGLLMYVEFGSVDYYELLRKSLCYMGHCILGLYDFRILSVHYFTISTCILEYLNALISRLTPASQYEDLMTILSNGCFSCYFCCD